MAPAHPSSEDREWLEHELTALLARVGAERFTRGPILEPSDRFFPDRFVEGPRGVRTVARRLFAWAGLDLDADVIDESPRDDARRIPTWEIELESVRPSYVALVLSARGKPEHLPGALTSHLSYAARISMGLDREPGVPYRSADVANDPELEAELAGITAIELGWGLLALDAAERHHSAGEVVGNWHSYEVATEQHGWLSIAALAYLLAVQLVVRGTSDEERARLCALLRPNQAKLLRAWCDELDEERDALLARLGVAESEAPLEIDFPEPFDDDEDEEDDGAVSEREERGWNFARPVFRVPDVPSGRYGFLGAVIGGAAGMALMALVGSPLVPGLGSLLGVAAGVLLARRRAREVCSDPACEAPLSDVDVRCPRCEGHVAGSIASAAKRLEAEEALDAAWYRERGLPYPSSIVDDEE